MATTSEPEFEHLRGAAKFIETAPDLEPPPPPKEFQRPYVEGPLLKPGVSKANEVVDIAPAAAVSARFTLTDRKDMLWFHLGSVYELVGVPTDMMAQFCTDCSLDRKQIVDISTRRLVCYGTQDHNNIVQGMPANWEPKLEGWILNLLFTRKEQKQWWRVKRRKMPIIDPTVTSVISAAQIVNVHFLVPYGSQGSTLVIAGSADGIPSLTFAPGIKPPEGTEPPEDIWQS